MKRRKIERTEEREDFDMTEENAASILQRYTKRSCLGGVQLWFDIRPGVTVPAELVRHCSTDGEGYPDGFSLSTKGEIRDGRLIGYALKGRGNNCIGEIQDGEIIYYTPEERAARRDDTLYRVDVPIDMIGPGILFVWHEWADTQAEVVNG